MNTRNVADMEQYLPIGPRTYIIWGIVLILGAVISSTAFLNPYFTIFAAFLILVVGIAITQPHYIYYVALAFTGIHIIIIWLFGETNMFLSLVEPIIFFGFIPWLIARGAGLSSPYIRNNSDVPLVLLFMWGWVSVAWSTELLFGTYQMGLLSICIAFYILTCAHLTSLKRVKLAITILIAGGLLNAAACFYSQFQPQDAIIMHIADYKNFSIDVWFNTEETIRGQGLDAPLRTAYFLSYSIILAIGCVYSYHPKWKIFFSMAAYVMFIALLMTVSKGPTLSLLLGVFAFILFVPRLRKHFIASLTVIIFLAILGFFISRLPTGQISTVIGYSTEMTTESGDEATSMGSRFIRWKRGVKAFANTWGLGTGSGGFLPYIEDYFLFDNLYMHAIVEYGIIGVLLWLWFFVSSVRRYIRAYKLYNSADEKKWLQIYLAGLVTLLVNGMSSENHVSMLIWFYLALGHALANIVDQMRQRNILGDAA